jgi:HSP20 family molecular chaperone IbpA
MAATNAKLEAICRELNELNHGLMDIYQEYGEAPAYDSAVSSEKFKISQENLDEFDWSGMQYNFSLDLTEAAPKAIDWNEVDALINEAIANGHLVEPEAYDYSSKRYYGSNILHSAGTYFKGDTHDKNFMLRQLKRLEDNPADVLSLDDSVFDRSHNKVSNFEMKVPLEIHGEGEELVIKADIPDILFSSANAEDLNVPFKSVLALLPERINTRQLKPTFVDGQFRLELPKRENKKDRQIY